MFLKKPSPAARFGLGENGFLRLLPAAGVAIALSAGCRRPNAPESLPVLSPSAADLNPGASPGDRATLRLGADDATEFEVGLKTTQEATSSSLDLSLEGEPLEREVYENSGSAFRVVTAGVDAFAPGIDLLRYPVRDGDAWDWEGKVAYAGISRSAHGRVSIRKDGGEIRSDVRLLVRADPGRPDLERRLAFWFRKGKGVVRRTFGGASSRYPVDEAWRP